MIWFWSVMNLKGRERSTANQNVNRQAHPYLGDRVISQGKTVIM